MSLPQEIYEDLVKEWNSIRFSKGKEASLNGSVEGWDILAKEIAVLKYEVNKLKTKKKK